MVLVLWLRLFFVSVLCEFIMALKTTYSKSMPLCIQGRAIVEGGTVSCRNSKKMCECVCMS